MSEQRQTHTDFLTELNENGSWRLGDEMWAMRLYCLDMIEDLVEVYGEEATREQLYKDFGKEWVAVIAPEFTAEPEPESEPPAKVVRQRKSAPAATTSGKQD